MAEYRSLSKEELSQLKKTLDEVYATYQEKKLNLNMSRGRPSAAQLDLMKDFFNDTSYIAQDGTDCRNYGVIDGLPEARELFGQMIGMPKENVIVLNNSSLEFMYNMVSYAMTHGVSQGSKPWGKYDKIKFLCPVPGYDRHFAITEFFGIEMINIPMHLDGPDMDMIEKLVAEDDTIKGLWCVPKYSNPTGITFSDEVVRRFAALKPKADDFRLFWDNAYCIHNLYDDREDKLLNIMEECKKNGTEDMVYMFTSTSKVTFAGAGLGLMASSSKNIAYIKKALATQTIGPNKLNQLRHVHFFKDYEGIKAHMKKHAAILRPRFRMVLDILEKELGGLGIGQWVDPNGGYFISFDSLPGCAKRIVELCGQAGVVMTPAGASFPYGIDPDDKNIRIAPTLPPIEELETAMNLFCICVKMASIEKYLQA